MRTCAIIPARSGSNSVPKKNLQTIGGISLLSRCIGTCLISKVHDVYVSTDDAVEIGAEAERRGATVIIRPPELATDTALSHDVLLDALQQLGEDRYDVLLFVQCTAPLMQAHWLDGTLQALLDAPGADIAMACVTTDSIVMRIGASGYAEGMGFDISNFPTRRQERQQLYAAAGAVWALRVPSFLERGTVWSERMVIYPVPGPQLDIDSLDDLRIARVLLD